MNRFWKRHTIERGRSQLREYFKDLQKIYKKWVWTETESFDRKLPFDLIPVQSTSLELSNETLPDLNFFFSKIKHNGDEIKI